MSDNTTEPDNLEEESQDKSSAFKVAMQKIMAVAGKMASTATKPLRILTNTQNSEDLKSQFEELQAKRQEKSEINKARNTYKKAVVDVISRLEQAEQGKTNQSSGILVSVGEQQFVVTDKLPNEKDTYKYSLVEEESGGQRLAQKVEGLSNVTAFEILDIDTNKDIYTNNGKDHGLGFSYRLNVGADKLPFNAAYAQLEPQSTVEQTLDALSLQEKLENLVPTKLSQLVKLPKKKDVFAVSDDNQEKGEQSTNDKSTPNDQSGPSGKGNGPANVVAGQLAAAKDQNKAI